MDENLGEVRARWGWFLTEGIVFFILGILAIALPVLFTFAITLLLGWLLIVGGIFQIVRLIRVGPESGKWASWLYAIAILVTGVLLIASPLTGALTLTLLLTAYFIIAGIAKIALAIEFRKFPSWGWLLFSGLLSLALAAIIISGWPGTALWVIGLLVGINLLFFGISMISLALSVKRA